MKKNWLNLGFQVQMIQANSGMIFQKKKNQMLYLMLYLKIIFEFFPAIFVHLYIYIFIYIYI